MRTVHTRLTRLKPLQRSVEYAINVPGLPRRCRAAGSVWAVTMVKNEADIIGDTVRHLLTQGVDGVIVVDNLSTDATYAVLESLAAEDCRVHIGTDRMLAYHQGRKMSYLAHLARRAGAEWIIPFDADEHWYSTNGSLAEFLRQQSQSVVYCAMHNTYPLPGEGSIQLDKVVAVTSDPMAWKVAFRSKDWAWLRPGNHDVDISGSRGEGLRLLHYQYRSFEQYSRKVVEGAQSVAAAGSALDAGAAWHWKRHAELNDFERFERWVSYCAGTGSHEADQSKGDRIRVMRPTKWRQWDPDGVIGV